MLRVLIADDEERICKLIQILTEWKELDMELAGTASNGLEALSQVEALLPDILITDIRMPGLSGLELIRRAKDIAPEIEVIIVSGYAQFDYAQTAIQFGVGDYLLKPINKDALNHTLEKIGRRCRARRKAEMDLETLRASSQDDLSRLRDNLLSDLLGGRFEARRAEQMERIYHFAAREDTYQVFLLKLDFDPKRFAEASLEIVLSKARDIFAPVLTAFCSDFLLGYRDAAMVGIMNYAAGEKAALRGRLRDCLNQLVECKDLYGDIRFSMALGQAGGSPGALLDSFDNARHIIQERLTEGTGRLLEGTVGASPLREMDLLARYVKAAANAIDVLSPEDADLAADALAEAASAVPHVHGWELLELVRGAGTVFVTRLEVEDRERSLADFERAVGQCSTARALFACLKAMQREQLQGALERKQNRDGQPVRVAKQYIQKHFARPITLEEVSEATGFSVSYFSTLFKKETGEGFAKYLAKVRMEEAKGLLRETRLPVAEVCRRVGYGDIKHFTRTFRAETGITPSEFRRLYG